MIIFSISQLARFPPYFSNNLHVLPVPLKDQVWDYGDGVELFSYGLDEGLAPVTVKTCGYKSDFSFHLFFLSNSSPTTDKLRLVKCSLNKPKHGITNTNNLTSGPSLQPSFSTKVRCKHIFFICRKGIKLPLHLW